jgi:hypothetical protein
MQSGALWEWDGQPVSLQRSAARAVARSCSMAATAVLLCAFALACGASGEPAAGEAPPDDDRDEQSRNFAELRASEEYQRSIEQIRECMSAQGYVGNPYQEGVSFPDGTVLKIGGEQTGFKLTGAYLDYRLAQEKCQQAAGYEAILQRHGMTSGPQGIMPERLQQLNEDRVAVMQCMGEKGWKIPEPVTLQGMFVFEVVHESDEREAAWNVDHAACNAELFGNIRGRE